jgi:sugar transferase (PEP-CTERM/EpsH1 system associated)
VENLLLLMHRLPYPPNKGDKIRAYHLLRHLSSRYRVYLGAFVDDAADLAHVPMVAALCADSHFARLRPLLARWRSLTALGAGGPFSRAYYADGGLRQWVDRSVREHHIGRILCYSSPMAQYAVGHEEACRILDFVDVDSDKWRQYAERSRWPMKALYAREARRLLQFERAAAQASDATLFVSAHEAALFRQLAPESAARIDHYSNGVDTEYFSPLRDYPSPFEAGARVVVFTGAMNYWPNVDAVTWFATSVMPEVLATTPDVRFVIVGSQPSAAVRRLSSLPGVSVTGTVPDVRPYLAHAALCVAPMRIARGLQNKVLEAMAMARTVLVSPQALEGIDARPGHELLVCSDAAAMAAAVLEVLAHPAATMGRVARARIESHYGWEANLARVGALIEGVSAFDGVAAVEGSARVGR